MIEILIHSKLIYFQILYKLTKLIKLPIKNDNTNIYNENIIFYIIILSYSIFILHFILLYYYILFLYYILYYYITIFYFTCFIFLLQFFSEEKYLSQVYS